MNIYHTVPCICHSSSTDALIFIFKHLHSLGCEKGMHQCHERNYCGDNCGYRVDPVGCHILFGDDGIFFCNKKSATR